MRVTKLPIAPSRSWASVNVVYVKHIYNNEPHSCLKYYRTQIYANRTVIAFNQNGGVFIGILGYIHNNSSV